MKNLLVALAVVVIALSASTSYGGWGYAGPVVVQSYYAPAAPVYAYPQVVAMPVVAPAVVYPAPVIVRSRVYYYGQPVRNVVRWAAY